MLLALSLVLMHRGSTGNKSTHIGSSAIDDRPTETCLRRSAHLSCKLDEPKLGWPMFTAGSGPSFFLS